MKNNYKYINNIYKNDFYSIKSKNNNLLSRSWFKIFEIEKKYNIFKKNINIIDLGSCPGGWSKFSSQFIGKKGCIFSCDILKMNHINGVKFFQGDLLNLITYNNFIKFIYCKKINVIISDILSNTSGFKIIDNSNNIRLIEMSLKICLDKLINKGIFICKLLQNNENNNIINKIKSYFNNVYLFKPNSSRSISREFYVIAKNFNKN